jgi:hypothetical protein
MTEGSFPVQFQEKKLLPQSRYLLEMEECQATLPNRAIFLFSK